MRAKNVIPYLCRGGREYESTEGDSAEYQAGGGETWEGQMGLSWKLHRLSWGPDEIECTESLSI